MATVVKINLLIYPKLLHSDVSGEWTFYMASLENSEHFMIVVQLKEDSEVIAPMNLNEKFVNVRVFSSVLNADSENKDKGGIK